MRKLCDNCKKKVGEDTYEAVGCEKCLNTGYHKRALITELVEMDSAMRKAVLEKADIEQLEKILKNKNHRTLHDDGLRLIGDGVTTKDEINKVCGVS